nr:uncharacterized protein LOC106731991 isoform X1 [Pelodiscus sinensis]|eukprot:XP_025040238.1 uncharacterized protein LOC106731991 isoform X1 [Pelodiscus sinensis]
MPHNCTEAQERRRPGAGGMDEAFFQLCQEFTRLQDLCAKQAELLQELVATQEPVPAMPISMPIQCTDAGGLEQPERSVLKQQVPKADGSGLPNPTMPPWPNTGAFWGQLQDSFSQVDITYPPRADAATVFLSRPRHTPPAGRIPEGDPPLGTDMTFPAWNVAQGKSTAPRRPLEHGTLHPEELSAFPSFLDLYRAPQELQVERASRRVAWSQAPIEIRGPTQTSWTPEWAVEDSSLGHSGNFELQGDSEYTDP